jgi:regulator of replication initiation timing
MFQKRLGYSMKEKKERKKNKRKRTNVPLKIKRDLVAQVSSQSFHISKRGI